MDNYFADPLRYDGGMKYERCGRSGVMLPKVSLGFWHNFGGVDSYERAREITHYAFDHGVVHFDLANNYGPPYGSAEETMGRLMDDDFRAYRDELFISTKAGYDMWPGPYGNWGSRKYLMASLDQSLKRMHLDYVDIFYHHRPDPDTPIEETMGALYDIVKSGKALYAGISNYNAAQAREASEVMEKMGMHLLIHQPNYSMFNRSIEDGLTDVMREKGIGIIAFGPLCGGLLTDRYIKGIPADSRAAHDPRFLKAEDITEDKLAIIRRLSEIARKRGQTLAQMALVWTLRDPVVTTALIGASRPEQVLENVRALDNPEFTAEELAAIDEVLADKNW